MYNIKERKLKIWKKKIVYIAKLDQDIDDVIAAEYLYNKNVLKCIVLDPYPRTKEGFLRKMKLEKLGIEGSKLCNVCGYKKTDLNLKDREWECLIWHTLHNRDYNAVINIKEEGYRLKTVRNAGVCS